MPTIHPTAILSGDVNLADDVAIGPGCVVTGNVHLEAGVRLLSQVQLHGEVGPLRVGPGSLFYPFACVGFPGQDLKFTRGMPSAGTVLGANCVIREHATIHAATKPDAPTRLGDRVYMMVASHVGHDARVDDDVTLVNGTALGGHVHVFPNATLGGGTVVHQHCRVGRLAFTSGHSALADEMPPFCVSWGRNSIVGINHVGLRRAGVPREQITLLRQAFRQTIRANLQRQALLARLAELSADSPLVAELREFYATSKRAVAAYRSPGRGEVED